MSEEFLSLRAAAERYGVPVRRLGLWCATGKLRCERDGDGWQIPPAEAERIDDLAREHAISVDEKRVKAVAVPVVAAPPDLAAEVADRLGLSAGAVSVTTLALDGCEYVVAVWRGNIAADGGLPALAQLASELDAELLEGEVVASE